MSSSVSAVRPLILRLDLAARRAAFARAQRGRLAPWLPVFMAAGIACYFSLLAEPVWWAGAAALAPAAAGAALVRGLRPALLPAAAAALGFSSAQLATCRALPIAPVPSGAVVVTGTVRGVDVLPEGRRLTLSGARFGAAPPLQRTVRVRLRDDDPAPLEAGDVMRVRALMRAPSPPAYPGGWDLQRDDWFSGLAGSGFAIGRAALVEAHPPTGFSARLRGLRDDIDERVASAIGGAPGAIAGTLLTGVTSSIPESDRAAFRDSGLAHLLAVAGLHIGIVMALVFGLVRRMLALSERAALRWPCKQIAAVAALASGGCYLLLTGAHVPIIRSFAMACVFTLAVLAGRRAVSLRGWAIAACGLMLISPWEVMGVSFQMSFSAVLALISGYEALRPRLQGLRGDGSPLRRVLSHVAALALTSFLAGTASAPFGAYHFGHVQAYYVLSNLLAVPITAAVVMPLGIASLALMPLGLEQLTLIPMGWGVRVILWIAHATADAPNATLAVPHIPAWGLATLSVGIAWLGLWRGPVRLAGAVMIAVGVLSAATQRAPDALVSPDAKLIGVREGSRLFVQSAPGGSRFVRDAWAQALATSPAEAIDEAPDALCSEAGCRLLDAVVTRDADRLGRCGDASLLLSASPARGACDGLRAIDRVAAARDGAAAVWFEPDGPRIVTDRQTRGERPWVPRPKPRDAAGLPPAEAE
jgi:competence protein ComEC